MQKGRLPKLDLRNKRLLFLDEQVYLLCQHAIDASGFSEVRFCAIDNSSITAQKNTQPRSACWVLEDISPGFNWRLRRVTDFLCRGLLTALGQGAAKAIEADVVMLNLGIEGRDF